MKSTTSVLKEVLPELFFYNGIWVDNRFIDNIQIEHFVTSPFDLPYEEKFEVTIEDFHTYVVLLHVYPNKSAYYASDLFMKSDECVMISDKIKELPDKFITIKVINMIVKIINEASQKNVFVYKAESLPEKIKQAMLFL